MNPRTEIHLPGTVGEIQQRCIQKLNLGAGERHLFDADRIGNDIAVGIVAQGYRQVLARQLEISQLLPKKPVVIQVNGG